MLESLSCVDEVVLFDSDEELVETIQEIDPMIMVKGSDYCGQPIIGEDYVPQIEFFERINEYSSTKAIQHLADR
jgi:bifunctional ADP-heptose synthase (sugar kinase/adenylyltransferase)